MENPVLEEIIKGCSVPDEDRERELELNAGKNAALREELILSKTKYALKKVYEVVEGINEYSSFYINGDVNEKMNDLYSEALFSLCVCVDRFDAEKAANGFFPYAERCITRAVYRKAKRRSDSSFHESSLDERFEMCGDHALDCVDDSDLLVVDAGRDYEEYELRRILLEAISNILAEREARIVYLCSGLSGREYSMTEVGEMYGITRSRVSQIWSESMKKIRRSKYGVILDDFRSLQCA